MSEHDTVRQSIRGKLDRVTGKPATIYTPPEDLIEPPQIRPELHTLYRFWVSAQAAGEPVDQEFDGCWSGRHWHALYDIGVWDPEFVVRFEPLVDERVAELEAALQRSRDDHQGAVERLTEGHRRLGSLIEAIEAECSGERDPLICHEHDRTDGGQCALAADLHRVAAALAGEGRG